MKKAKDVELLKELRVWLETHTAVSLAKKLEYKSSATINRWLHRKSIPGYRAEQVSRIIRKSKNAA